MGPKLGGMVGPLAGYTVAVTASNDHVRLLGLLDGLGATGLLVAITQTVPIRSGELAHSIQEFVADPPAAIQIDCYQALDLWLDTADSIGYGPAVRSLLNSSVPVAVGQDGQDLAEASHRRLPPLRFEAAPDRQAVYQLVVAVVAGEIDGITFSTRLAAEEFLMAAGEINLGAKVRSALEGRVVVAALESEIVGVFDCWPEVCVVCPDQPRVGLLVAELSRYLVSRSRALRFGGVDLVLQGRLVVAEGGEPVTLSLGESRLLDLLLAQPGVVVTKENLAEGLWGSGEHELHRVEVAIGRLRKRLGPAGAVIETVVRRGYRIRP